MISTQMTAKCPGRNSSSLNGWLKRLYLKKENRQPPALDSFLPSLSLFLWFFIIYLHHVVPPRSPAILSLTFLKCNNYAPPQKKVLTNQNKKWYLWLLITSTWAYLTIWSHNKGYSVFSGSTSDFTQSCNRQFIRTRTDSHLNHPSFSVSMPDRLCSDGV